MKRHTEIDPWKVIEKGFHPERNRVSESLFSIGNGRFGQRGNFEEQFSGDSLQGSYVAGVYYPDKTRVGWWKNGYPEYFAKVLNAPNWIGLNIQVNGEELDLNKVKEITAFQRELNMKNGVLSRVMEVQLNNGVQLQVESRRFCSLSDSNVAAMEYSVTSLNQPVKLQVESFIDGKIKNEDSNYDDKFWKGVESSIELDNTYLIARTRKTDFHVGVASNQQLQIGNDVYMPSAEHHSKKWASVFFEADLKPGERARLTRKTVILSSLNHAKADLFEDLRTHLGSLNDKPFADLLEANEKAWMHKWEESDILIEGDDEAQQGIRFNIFQLNCTYSGEDERLNIGPKGFTGEKYGGSTYWDTEAYCLPFYQATADPEVARNLLIYRYKHLDRAIENAEKLGFSGGAALYPMVTMNGEECHNEWEITFEEIHRNGAIAYAIYDYIRYTGDKDYLAEYGLEVLIGIARFWSQRVQWSEDKDLYVMLGVTGPNEFENNVNNNWYTNKIASWCLEYTKTSAAWVAEQHAQRYADITQKVNFDHEELEQWQHIVDHMYYPYSEKHQVYLQQDGFLDKALIPVSDLPQDQRPIVEHWSWDRILRSCYIKQADVLQGFYFFEDEYDQETIRRHFDFYEPLTVHESSLSPCVHSILAAGLGDEKRAHEFYLRTARLDLDDYNNDTCDGLHITSMAGTWMSIVKGFAGMRVHDGELSFKPFLPENWKTFSFKIRFRNSLKQVTVSDTGLTIEEVS